MKLRTGTPEEAGMSAERVQRTVDLAEGWVAQGVTSALVVLAARRGVIVIHEAFGHLTPEQDSPPLVLDAIFPIASITKPITATVAMILVEEGLLSLNRPVSWYIPEFTGEGKDAVMVHHLLTHTSGLRDDDLDVHAEKKMGTVDISPLDETQHPLVKEYLLLRYDAPLREPPGTQMDYCVYGYRLMGEIIRRISGMSIVDLARERIFGPLGMKNTSYTVTDPVRHRIVKRLADAPFARADTREYQDTPWASASVFSTASDMAIFGQMFLNRGVYGGTRILSPASVAEMTRNQIPGIGSRYRGEFFPEASWGYGWSIHGNKKPQSLGTLYSPNAFSHSGAGGMLMWIDPAYDIVGAYFSVESPGGIPAGVSASSWYLMCRMDLFMNAVTASVMDI